MDEQRFLEEYIDAFNRREYDTFSRFYQPDVELTLTGNRRLHGPEGILAHYRHLHQFVRETLRIDYLVMNETRIAAEMYTEFACFADYPEFSWRPLKAGDVVKMTNFVHYDVKDDLFASIRVAHFTLHD